MAVWDMMIEQRRFNSQVEPDFRPYTVLIHPTVGESRLELLAANLNGNN